jgi:4-diphosphocytidyl-2-C-methyl-D-erythritol kinase
MIERLAPAKINLALAVTGRREDGFHELVSVFLRVGLADQLSVEADDAPGEGDDLVVAGASGPIEGLNLVLHAAGLLRTYAGRPLPPLHFSLQKRIPVAGGLGGGSSDAAAALDLAAEAWRLALADGERLDLAARLGSDVPFFAAQIAAALVEGRGERMRPLPPPSGDPAALLVTALAGLSTGDVFGALDAAGPADPAAGGMRTAATARALAAALEAGLDAAAFAGWAGRLRDANDLWAPAATLRPELVSLRETLERRLARPVLLSGSGPTLLALYPSLVEAEAGRRALAGLDDLRIAATAIGQRAEQEAG